MHLIKIQCKGTFTVEAAVLLPLITFIVLGLLYVILGLHDRAMMQTYMLRAGESALAAHQFEGMGMPDGEEKSLQEAVVMSDAAGPVKRAPSFSLMSIYRSLKGYYAASAEVSASMQIPVPGIALFTGGQWDTQYHVTVTGVDYPADWFRYKIRKGGQ